MNKTYQSPDIVTLGSLKNLTLTGPGKTPGAPADFKYPKGFSFIFSY